MARAKASTYILGTGTVLNNGSGVSTMTLGTSGLSSGSFNGTIADNNNGGVGKMALVKVVGFFGLSGNNTFTGGVTINGGTLIAKQCRVLDPTAPNAVTFGPNSTGVLGLHRLQRDSQRSRTPTR